MATTAHHGFGAAACCGWGGLALVVLLGVVSSGFSGAALMGGMFALVAAVIGLVRGRIDWAHLHSRLASTGLLAGAVLTLVVGSATGPPSPAGQGGNHLSASASQHATPSATPGTTAASAAVSPATAAPHPKASPSTKRHASGPSAAPRADRHRGKARPRPPTAHAARPTGRALLTNAAGAVLPDPHRTPGAVNRAVTQATIGRTICVPGWTATVRPPSSVTTGIKEAQLASGYTYRGDTATSDYEEDHLISLELGGAPASTANLWPEPYTSPEGARVKDVVENRLHALVCSHAISLGTARHAIAANWWAAYQKYGTSSYSAPTHAATHLTPAPHTPTHASAPANGATARCHDGTYSYAAHHQGACSHHGGVDLFYK